jgi:hypothetical protein
LKQLRHPEVDGSTFLQNTGAFTHYMEQQYKDDHDLIGNHQKA